MHRHLILSLALLFLVSLNTYSQISYVKAGATGNGTSWNDASGDLQAVLAASTSGAQIWVAAGTYHPTICNPCSFTDRDTPFTIPDGVALYGGFSGNETDLNQRDWQSNLTILSGDIDQDGQNQNNSYTILYTRNVSATTVIDGFEITSAYAENISYDVYTRINSGAGLYNDGSLSGGSSHPTIRNCKFTDHYGRGFGAAIMNYGGFGGSCSPEIYDCEFINNEVFNNGGAVYNSGVFSGQTETAFIRCIFKDNYAVNGGAIYNQGSESGSSAVTFLNCQFENNTASSWGGAIVEFGNNGSCLPTYNGCTFFDNSADIGGAILNDGSFGGISDPIYINCNWNNNFADLGGGGVYSQGPFGGQSNPSFMECTFDNNQTTQSGGALYHNGQDGTSDPKITNSIFSNNEAMMYGGGMYNFGKSGQSNAIITNCLFVSNQGAAAGAIYNYGGVNGQSNPEVTNCTFTKNSADVGPCIYNQAADATGTVQPVVSNSIFWDNYSASGFGLVFQNGHAQPSINHCLVQVSDCSAFNTDPNSNVTCGSVLLFDTDPQFTDPSIGNYHLEETSPALDLGDNASINATGITIDLDSVDRVANGVVDFGVYEYQSTAYQPPVVVAQASSSSHCEEDNKTLYVVTSGTPPLTYQWRKNAAVINGATDSILVFSSLEPGDGASYTCVVTGSQGSSTQSNPIIVEVDPLLTVELTIQASETNICEGSNVIFNAIETNGGATPTYAWFVNGTPVGGNQSQLQLNTLANNDEVTCQLTSSEDCTVSNTVISNAIQMTVQQVFPVEVTIEASQTTICSGDTVTLHANTQYAGLDPSYSWFLNGQLLTDSLENITLSSLSNGDQVVCELTSSANCTTNNPAVSSAIIFQVDTLLSAGIILTASSNSICSGETIVFDVVGENEGADPVYAWYINNEPITSTGSQLILDNLEDGDEVTCELTSSYACLEQNPVLATPITIEVNDQIEAGVDITASALEICAGEEINFNAIPTNEGTNPEYIWLVNGVPTGNNVSELLLINPMDGDLISCLLISSEDCLLQDTVTSSTLEILVNESVDASILIETTAVSICEGEEVEITASPQNMGTDPEYKWLVNGVNQNINTAAFTTDSLTDGDVVACELTSSLTCLNQNPVISNSLTFTVAPSIEASIDIDVNTTTACVGDTLTFTATTANEGAQPTYQWLLDGVIEIGEDEPVLKINDLAEGTSTIRCVLTSSEDCVDTNPIPSNSIVIDVIDDETCIVGTSNLIPGIQEAYVFPNPAFNGQFTLALSGDLKGLRVNVRDVQGRLWYTRDRITVVNDEFLDIKLSEVVTGLFYVELISDENIQVLKLLLL